MPCVVFLVVWDASFLDGLVLGIVDYGTLVGKSVAMVLHVGLWRLLGVGGEEVE